MASLRSYLPFVRAPFRPLTPSYLIFFVTDRCNARCGFCFNPLADTERAQSELTIAEIEQVARGLKGLIQLTIAGGEPFLREDLPAIVRAFTRESRVKFVTLPTNAFLPERVIPATEQMLADNPSTRFTLCLSIDDIGARHDEIRVVERGFEKLRETFYAAQKLAERFTNLELHTTTTLSSLNASRVEEVLDWIHDNLGASFPEILLVRGSPHDPATASVDLATYERAARKIAAMSHAGARRGGFKLKLITSLTTLMSEILVKSERMNTMLVPCTAGKKLVILRSDGVVDPCEVIETIAPPGTRPPDIDTFSMGNVRDADYKIATIMRSKQAQAARRFIKESRCHCTFECALFANLIFTPSRWPTVAGKFLRDWALPH